MSQDPVEVIPVKGSKVMNVQAMKKQRALLPKTNPKKLYEIIVKVRKTRITVLASKAQPTKNGTSSINGEFCMGKNIIAKYRNIVLRESQL